ncbi:MAG: sulfotransferase [Pseudomonadales bacterium]|nr:sulfotransferase [Pseudomonadales bacterium]
MDSTSNYSRLDRALHKVSFGSSILQEILTDIESALFSKSWAEIPASKPVFITSLPRAGTTIILEALYRLPGLAAHTYRDMPLIYTPVLWNKLSGGIRSKGTLRERAHGDGLVISEDSPEAFEEVLWTKFFSDHYSGNSIPIWDTTNTKFREYFLEHMKKIISLRCPDDHNSRYVSKNNANIARTRAIKAMFTDASIVIPLRNPIDHALSLLRQHTNFLKQHATDKFVAQYMKDIGHYEFGELHRPIQFPQFSNLTSNLPPESLNYWLGYWIAAFEYLSVQQEVSFISYENLCLSPNQGLGKLCQHIELEASPEEIATASAVFNAPAETTSIDSLKGQGVDRELLDRARDLHRSLLSRCLLKQ